MSIESPQSAASGELGKQQDQQIQRVGKDGRLMPVEREPTEQLSPLAPSAKLPLTFSERSYWWLWIPVIAWIPFAIPIVLPLGPIMVGFSVANKMRFIWEAAAHNGESLPSGINSFISGFYTLGYNSVYRTYKATKKMLAEEGIDTIPGWAPWFLPLYILCPALVYMPLIRAMCKHWQWHERKGLAGTEAHQTSVAVAEKQVAYEPHATGEAETEQPRTEQADPGDGFVQATCPVCGASMDVYEALTSGGSDLPWIGTCPTCGAEVEGETPAKLQVQRP
jgi:hypothetical protein